MNCGRRMHDVAFFASELLSRNLKAISGLSHSIIPQSIASSLYYTNEADSRFLRSARSGAVLLGSRNRKSGLADFVCLYTCLTYRLLLPRSLLKMRGLRIRFSRHGIRNQPLYHIVVLDQSKAQRALPLEKLGEYDPVPQVPSVQDLPSSSFVFGKAEQEQRVSKERKLSWNVERMKYWLKQGAQPTGAVAKLMEIVSSLRRFTKTCLPGSFHLDPVAH